MDGIPQPLQFTRYPRLEAAIAANPQAWLAAALLDGPERVSAWLATRLATGASAADLEPIVTEALGADDPVDRAVAMSELAELAEVTDDLVADTLWELVLGIGRDVADGDLVFEATSRLAMIAEEHGDLLAAADYYVEFLNWRRADGHASDPDTVHASFEEVIRLAEEDGNPDAAARFTHRHAQYGRLADAGDERATVGDWDPAAPPYPGWE